MALELATNHGHGQDFTAVPEDFERFLADPSPVGGAFIAFWAGEPAGSAIWHRSFSTFRGRETLYLEDLSVLPGHRHVPRRSTSHGPRDAIRILPGHAVSTRPLSFYEQIGRHLGGRP